MRKKRVVKEPSDKAPVIKDLMSDMPFYTIDKNHIISKTTDIGEWGELMVADSSLRIVNKTRLDLVFDMVQGKEIKMGFVEISTVFLGIDHNFFDDDNTLPILFETMVYGGLMEGEQDRCCTWEAAEKMHELMCEKVKHSIDNYNEI